ncbi:MAG: hypothetical protein ACI8QS_003718 [Planctomycetota bacterium]
MSFVLLRVIGFALFAAGDLRVLYNSISRASPAEELTWATTILLVPITLLRTDGTHLLGLLGLTFQGLALCLAFHLRRFHLARRLSPALWLVWFAMDHRALANAAC